MLLEFDCTSLEVRLIYSATKKNLYIVLLTMFTKC